MNFFCAMEQALAQAQQGADADEVPVGAVIVQGTHIIARANNRVRRDKNPTAHAEMLAIQQAAQVLNSERLLGCVLYVTLEPCPMCLHAAMHARIERIIYGTAAIRHGLVVPELIGGIKEIQCQALLHQFFNMKRVRPVTRGVR